MFEFATVDPHLESGREPQQHQRPTTPLTRSDPKCSKSSNCQLRMKSHIGAFPYDYTSLQSMLVCVCLHSLQSIRTSNQGRSNSDDIIHMKRRTSSKYHPTALKVVDDSSTDEVADRDTDGEAAPTREQEAAGRPAPPAAGRQAVPV